MWIIIIGIVVVLFIVFSANGQQKRDETIKPISEYDYYKQKKKYENSIYEENIKYEKSSVSKQTKPSNSSTQKLTASDIRSFFPYMDSQLALKYGEAIINGQYSFDVDKRLVEQWTKNRILKNSGPMRADSTSMPTSEYTKVTWWQIQQYFPIMDSKISADYFAEHLLDESKWFTVKTTVLKEWEKKLAVYKNNENSLQLTVSNNNKGIAFEKQGDIASAIAVYESNLKIGYPATHSYERLTILYHKAGDIENEKRVINMAIQVFTGINEEEVKKFQKRLMKLKEDYVKPTTILPKEATIYYSKTKPLGVLYEEVKLRFKEFDFYNSGEDRSSSFLNDNNKHEIWKIQNKFKKMILDAKEYEEQGRLDKASKIYERILFEQFYLPTPYDKLIKIYSKAKLQNEERRVLELSINHFTELRDRQRSYIYALARKYNKYDFAKDRVDNEKKITYYNGAFELYNPYPIISKWQERLIKLTTK